MYKRQAQQGSIRGERHQRAQRHAQHSAGGGQRRQQQQQRQHAGISVVGTPYQYGDGTTGYQIVFPRVAEEMDEQAQADEAARVHFHVRCAIWLSLLVNIVLFVSKTYSALASPSLSVGASAVDSLLDLASQGIVFAAERGSRNAQMMNESVLKSF